VTATRTAAPAVVVHELLNAGCAVMGPVNRRLTNGRGVGVCECGAYSPLLPTTGDRVAWHRSHKAAVPSQPRPRRLVDVMVRPNGRVYRPRSLALAVVKWEHDDYSPTEDDTPGVVVFGTLDPETARPLAARYLQRWLGATVEAERPRPGWYRSIVDRGDRIWFRDGERGRPGVQFSGVGR